MKQAIAVLLIGMVFLMPTALSDNGKNNKKCPGTRKADMP